SLGYLTPWGSSSSTVLCPSPRAISHVVDEYMCLTPLWGIPTLAASCTGVVESAWSSCPVVLWLGPRDEGGCHGLARAHRRRVRAAARGGGGSVRGGPRRRFRPAAAARCQSVGVDRLAPHARAGRAGRGDDGRAGSLGARRLAQEVQP